MGEILSKQEAMGHHLHPDDFYLDDVDSEVTCEACGDPIGYKQKEGCEQVIFGVLVPDDTGFEVQPVLCAYNDGQDFDKEPLHFDGYCWDDILDTLRDYSADCPPTEDHGAPTKCTVCGDALYFGERVAWARFGTIKPSKRLGRTQFVPDENSGADLICLSCLSRIIDDDNGTWVEAWDVSQNGECHECQTRKCWRFAGCRCSCHQT